MQRLGDYDGPYVDDAYFDYGYIAGEEFGWRPYGGTRAVELVATTDCGLIVIPAAAYEEIIKATPQLNYQSRKRLVLEGDDSVDWLLGEVAVY